jgi:hypothetical protein
MRKCISFTDQTPYPNRLDARRKPADIILQEMRNPKLQLQGINIPFGSMPQTRSTGRGNKSYCDTCISNFGEGAGKDKCVEKTGTGYNVCTNCYDVYGRPCCTWTPDLYGPRVTGNDQRRVRITDIHTRTLVIQPRAEATNPSYDPLLQELVDTIPEEQAVNMEDLEQEWGEGANDEFNPKDGEW